MNKEKVYLVVNSGCSNYEQYYNISIITKDKEKAKRDFEQNVKDLKCDFDFDNIDIYSDEDNNDSCGYILESDTDTLFSIYMNGYASEESGMVQLLEKEID